MVEKLLVSAISGEGFSVKRTGIGSDCEVEYDYLEEGEVRLLEIGGKSSFLVEIKSARSDKVCMTVPQALMALKEKDRFVLCVVAIGDSEISENNIRPNAFFLPDIGVRLMPAIKEFAKWQAAEVNIRKFSVESDIDVTFDQRNIRFRIPTSPAQKDGLAFDRAMEHFRTGGH